MAIFKCKMCGGDLEITKGELTAECSFCGSRQTLPRLDDDRKANLYDRANHFRRANDFDKAMGIYDQILNEDNTDAEAYWSLVLCRYGIEYVEDPASHRRVPTVNRAQYTSIFADEDYKSAIQNADVAQKVIYEQEARAIDEIQKGILEISQKEEPFDVFICYKETDNSGRRTQDSVLANDLYHQLTQEGFKVFFSRITLEDKLGTAYEPYIFAALNSAKVMVVLGTKAEYYNAVWVKNEWSRYLALIKNGAKKMLIPAYRDMDPYDLPEEFSHLQAQDMSKLGFMQDLIRGIKKILEADSEKASVKETVVVQQAAALNSNVQALLKRGNMALEDGEWDKADGFFEEVLNQEAECADAYLGKLLAREHKSSFDSYIISQRIKYDAADSKQLEACPEDVAARVGAVKKYAIENYLSERNIAALFPYDRAYSSQLEIRTQQKDRQLRDLSADKLLNRIKQYMSGEFADMINAGLAKIEAALDKRIKEAKAEDDKSIAQVTAAYKAHISEAEKKAKEMYDAACEKREGDYQECLNKLEKAQTSSDYLWLKNDFDKLGDYKEARQKAQYCEQEHVRLNEEARLSAAREKAKEIRYMIIAAVTAVVAILAIIVVFKVIIPANKYNAAQKALAEGRYEDAIAGFTELGDYKNAADKKLECQYQYAGAMLESGEYEKAVEKYKELGSYKDAVNQILECQYQYAGAMLESGKYEEAIGKYTELGDYKDAADQIFECQYQYAGAMLESGEYEEAIEKYKELGDYKDSAIMHRQTILMAFEKGMLFQVNYANNEWIVLASEDEKLLLLSKYVIESRPYNDDHEDITWEECSLRKWLNYGYIKETFTEEEQQAIVETEVVNSDNPNYGTLGGNNTKDKIFLLSIDEAKKYFKSNKERRMSEAWWLRSPGYYSDFAAFVNYDGSVYENGDYVYYEGDVRPAFWIDASNL